MSGTAWIEDDGDGTPSLERLELGDEYLVGFVQSSSLVGTYELKRSLSAEPGQAGSGDTQSAIDWGALTGWTQTGYLRCPKDCFQSQAECDDACQLFVGFSGTGPLPPLADGPFDSDPWVFDGGGVDFEASPIEIVNLAGGVVQEHLVWRGSYTGPVPAFPLLGLLALGGDLAYLGGRSLERRPSTRSRGDP